MSNRVIKFRAWNLTHCWMEDCFCVGAHDGVAYDAPSITHDTPNTEIEEYPDYIVMQFTGLHDKNGVEIYEGDIVSEGGEIATIEWLGEYACFGYQTSTSTIKMYAFHGEVIGNIHENPELLELKS